MDLILSAAFVRFDAWFLIVNLFLLVAASVSYVVERLFWLFRVVSPVSQAVRAASTASSENAAQVPDVAAPKAAESSAIAEAPAPVPNKKSKKSASETQDAPTQTPADSASAEGSQTVVESGPEPASEPVPTSGAETVEKDDAGIPASSGPTPSDRAQAGEIARLVKTKIARGEFTEAKAKIIEGLTYDKFDKELNCLLASLYERDRDFKKAELVYKDLIIVHDGDSEIYMKLGFALSMQGKYEIAYEIYRKLHAVTGGNDESVDMLANLAYQLERFPDALAYSKEYVKRHPRNIEMLNIVASCQINLGERRDALETLEKLRIIDPYNARVREFSQKLAIELELEGNFGNNSDSKSA